MRLCGDYLLYMAIQDGIRIFRKRKGFDLQADLAKAAGCSVATISSIERGERKPSYELSVKLLELGATTEELFGIDCRGSCPHAEKEPELSENAQILKRLESLERIVQSQGNVKAG